jgi:sulfite exporter TauE/SafE
MTPELTILLITAASLGFFHTLFGPDHYLPFIVIAKAKKWSLMKTAWITFLCGLGHVGSSLAIGTVGIVFGVALFKIEFIEGFRGNIAGWLLFGFGLAYFIWSVLKTWRSRPHAHFHMHEMGMSHDHEHSHFKKHVHVHGNEANLTPWVLFIIFVFGPCEVLIPLLMYPAAEASWYATLLVAGVFSATTVTTMLAVVTLGTFGFKLAKFSFLERHSEAVAGLSIMLCGAAIQFLGL